MAQLFMNLQKALVSRINPVCILKETKNVLSMSYRISSTPRLQPPPPQAHPPLAQKITDDPVTPKSAQSTVTCMYQTHLVGFWRNITVLWTKNLMNHYLNISVDSLETDYHHSSCKIDLKPWHFWSKKGYKTFEVDGSLVEVYWDLRTAKFSGGGPEPCADFYVAIVSDEEVVLLLGDHKKKAYKRTKSKPALVEALMFYKKEHVFGKKSFSTRAMFDHQGRKEHDIVVESSTSSPRDPEMWISIDGIVLIHIRNLQWKFRGNQTVLVDKLPVQVFWDVHAWLFCSPATACSSSSPVHRKQTAMKAVVVVRASVAAAIAIISPLRAIRKLQNFAFFSMHGSWSKFLAFFFLIGLDFINPQFVVDYVKWENCSNNMVG